jgi:hypothetical protein
VQGVKAYPSVSDIPDTELAIIAIPSKGCPDAMEILTKKKGVKAFVVISAGFGEETHEGALLEKAYARHLQCSRRLSDRSERYRSDEHQLPWCIYAARARIQARWRRFHLQFRRYCFVYY